MKIRKSIHIAAGGILGLGLSWLFSSPSSSVKSRIPTKSIRNFYYLPNFIIKRKKYHYHIHHWSYLTIAYLSFLFIPKNIPGLFFTQSLLAGFIIQGLTYEDRFVFKKNKRRFRFF